MNLRSNAREIDLPKVAKLVCASPTIEDDVISNLNGRADHVTAKCLHFKRLIIQVDSGAATRLSHTLT
jgi:hypothetical protein